MRLDRFYLMLLLSVLVLVIGIVAGFQGKTAVLVVCALSSFGFMCFGNLDRISEFTAGKKGIEAKTDDVGRACNLV